jgi:hypothetical protein
MAAMSFVAATRHRPGTETECSGIGLLRLAEHRTVSCGRLRPHGTRCRTVPKGSSLRIRMRIGLDVRGCGVGPSRCEHPRAIRPRRSSATLIGHPHRRARRSSARGPTARSPPGPLSETSSVRLVGVGDCRVYAAFDANPGGFYSIRFAHFGSVSIDEIEDMEAGPGLNERDGGPTDASRSRTAGDSLTLAGVVVPLAGANSALWR